MPDRRTFLATMGAAAVAPWVPSLGAAAPAARRCTTLVLIELQGGNDGFNTAIPYADPRYYALRPRLAVRKASALPLDAHTGLHPALRPLMPWWDAGELAVIQGVGDASASFSHMSAIEAWDFAPETGRRFADGWAARALKALQRGGHPVVSAWVDGVPGPLAGFPAQRLRVPGDAADGVGFRAALDHAARVACAAEGPLVVRVGLRGFDTHAAQAPIHARLLATLADALARLAREIIAADRWDSTVVLTYSEFGRRAAENDRGGTDHGTAGVQLALGGRVAGGIYGAAASLCHGACAVDFRSVYADLVERGWGGDVAAILGAGVAPLRFVRA